MHAVIPSSQRDWIATFPTPGLSRMMVFADGENIVFRYQDLLSKGRRPAPDVYHEPDVIAWAPDAVRPDLHHVIRATYYASAAGDEQRISKLAEIIRTLQFRQYAPPGALHISSLLGNKMTSYILKKQNKAQKSKGIDIQLTVDILVNAYQNNLDTVYLLSGDADFVPVLEEVRRLGKRIYVAAFSSGLNPRIRAVADEFHDLDGCFFHPEGC
jgi:uncharacterized LabA/DUF88 family protein